MKKKLLFILSVLFQGLFASAQPVLRTSVVEHFTNTYCSICAGRNPGFYSNLAAFPQILHISYYPSSPYAACPFSQMNKPEQDARTRFYDIFGSTPRLVINGSVVPSGVSFNDPVIFTGGLTQTSDFALMIKLRRSIATVAEADITVRKLAPNNLDSLSLYAALTEDTVHFNAANGENVHFDKFIKSLTGAEPVMLAAPAAVGDSITRVFSFSIGASGGDVSATAILQDKIRNGIQAARSQAIPSASGIPAHACPSSLCVYPVPAKDELRFAALPGGYHPYAIRNAVGQVVQQGVVSDIAIPLSIQSLAPGHYIIFVGAGSGQQRSRFVKQ